MKQVITDLKIVSFSPNRSEEEKDQAKQEFEDSIVDGLQQYLDQPLRLHKALVGTQFVKGDRNQEQESLVRMILKCEDLQTWLVTLT